MPLASPPETLCDPAGNPRFGMYRGPIPVVDLDRARVPGWPGPLAGLRLKQWEHWLLIHPQVAVTLAVVDAAITHLVWVQVIDRQSGERWEHRREGPLVRARTARSLLDERASGGASGLEVEIHDHLAAGEHRLRVEARSAGLPELRIEARADAGPPAEPLAVVLPVGRGRAMYSHKVPLPLGGEIAVGERRYALDPATCTAVLDVHKAHYPRETWWQWATGVGIDAAGRRVAFNLTANVVTEPALNENVAWVDGRAEPLGAARFSLAEDPWSVRTEDGTAELVFNAQGERGEDLDYHLVRSQFRQRYGTFRGRLRLRDQTVALEDAFGLFEDHRATW